MVSPVICLMGPTASGKTDLAMALADRFDIDIISVDSALVYQGMNIGTAKPSAVELKQYPHQLIDLIKPTESYSAARFVQDVNQCITNSFRQKKIPLLVGGTMLYFQAIQRGLSQLPSADDAVRAKLLITGNDKGWPYLHQRLADIDPEASARIHPHDQQRIQRALEVYQLTGKPLSQLLTENTPLPYHFKNFLLMPMDRAWLHQRIEQRFKIMLANGLVEEAEAILSAFPGASQTPSFRMVGYRQAYQYLQGELTDAELLANGVAATRQLAKRQITWLRRWPHGSILIAEKERNHQRIIAIFEEILDNLR